MVHWIGSDELGDLVRGRTVVTCFRDTVRRRPDAVALRWKDGEAWKEWTWSDYADRVCRLAGALGDLGVRRGDRVVLMMRNRPEFHVADLAVLGCGATPISIYNSSSAEQVQYLASHCEASVAIVEDEGFLARFAEVRDQLPKLRELVMIDGRDDGAHAWDALLAHDPVDLDVAANVAQPEDLATVIYTSGTTGPPKGVMLDHENVCFTVECLRRCLEGMETEGRRMVSYLPMAHIAERMTSHYQGVTLGYEVSTCPDPGLIAQYLPQVRPEVFFAVPRVWEKIHAGVMAMALADPQRKADLEAALGVGLKVSDCRTRGEELSPDLAAAWEQADAGLSAVRALLGLDACVTAISGAAPISVDVFDFFRALGVPSSEIYGMSESSGPMTWEPFRIKAGTVGTQVPGCEVRLADDGEVICRGGNVFRGYLNDPEKTAEALIDGWLHSGDIGVLDAEGYLKIVDRKKELIITAGGKNISPANLESALKSQELISQACVIGDQRPFISALVVLDSEVAPGWAKRHGIEAVSLAELADHPEVRAEVEREVQAAMAPFNNAERVKKVEILHREWMPDSEELTPTMKLKRRGIHAKYAREIERIYG
ncbi:MAG: long-chain fatty acid--CoA ligase [Actinobacteria bacterium]|nr:long-chain fatty acid--CoA ligase [Actinomycetota bacterium]